MCCSAITSRRTRAGSGGGRRGRCHRAARRGRGRSRATDLGRDRCVSPRRFRGPQRLRGTRQAEAAAGVSQRRSPQVVCTGHTVLVITDDHPGSGDRVCGAPAPTVVVSGASGDAIHGFAAKAISPSSAIRRSRSHGPLHEHRPEIPIGGLLAGRYAPGPRSRARRKAAMDNAVSGGTCPNSLKPRVTSTGDLRAEVGRQGFEP